ncbi:hypothetical protein PTTG_03318 [Puccinia triticina 1-1 BBBD Race 1]|uniref:Uncharacterized protein n=1 Tax=Puccinia triticina (isolate 1-1 / race 1 (BBBD)) TaxID=630390 RepID=A0A0C4ERA1_PUCT1|nr:hypothetical protein PTTG_03318 [Puccinia triticina 1-1 BBBD Race 1]
MKTHLTSLTNGTMPTSITHLQSHLTASGIPDGNSAFSRSMHDFTRILLGIEATKSDLPPSPPPSQLTSFQTKSNEAYTNTATLTSFRSYLSEHNISQLAVGGRSKSIPVVCRDFFIEDLAKANIHHVTFAWHESPGSPYNEWFGSMIWKHWMFAKNNGLLHKYAISPAEDTYSNAQKVLFRWIHGRQCDLRQSSRTPNWRELKSSREKRSKRRKQLSDHRVDTCVALSLPANLTRIFMDADCTSDTEEDDLGNLYRINVPWRSQEFTQFAHNLDNATIDRLRREKGARYIQKTKLLELRRRPAINTSQAPRVPIGLPRNCYNPVFLQSRPEVAQEVLNTQEPLEFPSI